MVASANLWVKFFQAAGVPSSTAATYAHIFCENRMELDMLLDLNKEYLREMGISPMGDIIAILRHAKIVSDQNAREKVFGAEKQSVATLSVSPLVASVVSKNSRTDSPIRTKQIISEVPPAKPARRVLPEHEGRYKIKLPSGTTERSKEILSKKISLIDQPETKKKGIFDRLEMERSSPDQTIQMTTVGLVGKPISSSIFSRLGGKSEIEEEIDVAYAGIFKSASKKLDGIKKPPVKQKVILVKKIPAKAATMIADEYSNAQRMETGEKSVSFSTEDEILEIESRRTRLNKNRPTKNNNIRARLGLTSASKQQTSPSITVLHGTQKVIKLKQPVKRANGSPIKTAGLKSDQTIKSVKSRLSLMGALAAKPEVSKLVNRIGRVSLTSRLGKSNSNDTANGKKAKSKGIASSSVFDRLGFNKK